HGNGLPRHWQFHLGAHATARPETRAKFRISPRLNHGTETQKRSQRVDEIYGRRRRGFGYPDDPALATENCLTRRFDFRADVPVFCAVDLPDSPQVVPEFLSYRRNDRVSPWAGRRENRFGCSFLRGADAAGFAAATVRKGFVGDEKECF